MRTNFHAEQLTDPHLRDAEKALRTCVHCGFCTATCPTYLVLGDERDSPRGRIMLMQQMLESGSAPNAETVKHLDQCLSCLNCRTACPSGVDYPALIDQSRIHIEQHYTRPFPERLYRNFILFVLTHPLLFRALSGAARAFAPIVRRLPGKLGAMSRKSLRTRRSGPFLGGTSKFAQQSWATGPNSLRKSHSAEAPPLPHPLAARILLLPGCVQRAIAPEIDAAATRVLARQGNGVERLVLTGCCGSLALHMGKAEPAKQFARDVIEACEAAEKDGPVDAVLIAASGCTAFLKDYGTLFAGDPEWQTRAERIAAKARDFVELAKPDALPLPENGVVVAFHPPCSLQHGQRIHGQGEALLRAAGFKVVPIPDAHLCCGSAGSYSLLHPEIAEALRERKLADIRSTGADILVSDNIGCLAHLAPEIPALHIAELLDSAHSHA